MFRTWSIHLSSMQTLFPYGDDIISYHVLHALLLSTMLKVTFPHPLSFYPYPSVLAFSATLSQDLPTLMDFISSSDSHTVFRTGQFQCFYVVLGPCDGTGDTTHLSSKGGKALATPEWMHIWITLFWAV